MTPIFSTIFMKHNSLQVLRGRPLILTHTILWPGINYGFHFCTDSNISPYISPPPKIRASVSSDSWPVRQTWLPPTYLIHIELYPSRRKTSYKFVTFSRWFNHPTRDFYNQSSFDTGMRRFWPFHGLESDNNPIGTRLVYWHPSYFRLIACA